LKPVFELGQVLQGDDPDPKEFAETLTNAWLGRDAAAILKPVVAKLVKIGLRHPVTMELDERVSESVYVMF
jgi:hypothetical protein